MSYELKDFRTEVIDASLRHPVLVCFWATWCGPCLKFAPVLEELVSEANGAWTLVKVNVDEHQEIAGQFGIRGVPASFLIYEGRMVDSFSGLKTKEMMQDWLAEQMTKCNVEDAEPEEMEAPPAEDLQSMEAVLAENPEDMALKLEFGKKAMFENAAKAEAVLSNIPDIAAEYDQAQQLLWLAQDLQKEAADLPEHEKIKSHYVAAIQALRAQDFDGAIDGYLEVLYRDRGYADDGARKGILGIFAFLGRHHEIPTRYYRRFEMALF